MFTYNTKFHEERLAMVVYFILVIAVTEPILGFMMMAGKKVDILKNAKILKGGGVELTKFEELKAVFFEDKLDTASSAVISIALVSVVWKELGFEIPFKSGPL
jgi:hypothetical protein